MVEKKPQLENSQRRTVLALGLTGVVAFVLGKLFGNSVTNLFSEDGGDFVIGNKDFKNFRIREDGEEMVFSDKTGDPIFIVDKESFKE